MKSEATSRTKENYFMLDNSYREETIEELTVVVMLGRIEMKQLSDGNAERVPSDDAKSCQVRWENNGAHLNMIINGSMMNIMKFKC
ncbi:hypothetical protein Tco_0017657 [Tanacetum coccineum]